MKGRSLLGLMVGLSVLAPRALSKPQSATAAPAPTFRPIVRDIQNRLPRGMVMRLPAFINFRNITTVYSSLEPYERGLFRISLTSEPSCKARYCELGYIAGIRRDSYYGSSDWEWARTEQKTGTSITLKRGVRGVYINVIRGGAVIWEQDGLVFIVSLGGDKQKIIDTAISMANESPIYDIARSNSQIATGRSPSTGRQTTGRSPANGGQRAMGRSPATGGQTTTGRSPTPRQTYRDARELGMAQLLQGNQKLKSAYEALQRASQEQYEIVNIPSTDFLTNPFADVGTSTCGSFGCKREPFSYADYLKLKLKLQAQEPVFNRSLSIIPEIEQYNIKLNNDNRYGGRDSSQKIVANFRDYWSRVEQQTKAPSLSLESISRKLGYALEETRVSTINLVRGSKYNEGFIQTGGKLASAFTALGDLIKILNLPELKNPESVQRTGRSIDYTFKVKQKLDDIKKAALAGDSAKLNDLTLEIADATILLIDSPDTRLSRFADGRAILAAANALKDRHNLLKQSQLTKVLDGFDKTYLMTAQVSSAVEVVASTLSFIAPGNKAVTTFASKADVVKTLLFNALEFSYKTDATRQYTKLKAYTARNQEIISGLSSFINFTAQEVGQYLIKNRTDVVSRRPDGTIAVSADGVLYPR